MKNITVEIIMDMHDDDDEHGDDVDINQEDEDNN